MVEKDVQTVLLWDEDICWEELLRKELKQYGISVRQIESVTWKRELLASQKMFLGLIVSDEQLRQERLSLEQVCDSVKAPVFLLVEKEKTEQEISAFCSGVYDYFGREKDICAVASRIRGALLHRYTQEKESGVSITEEPGGNILRVGAKSIRLTSLEFQVFHCLYAKLGNVVGREEIYHQVWKQKKTKNMRVVDTVIKQLRAKLKETRFVILSSYKLGYLLQSKETD